MRLPFLLFMGLLMTGFSAPNVQAQLQDEEGGGEVMAEGKLKLTFDPFHISLIKRGRLRGTADVHLVLQLNDNREYDALNLKKPQLRADITSALSTLARERWQVARPIDPDIIKAYVQPYVDYRIGAGKVVVYVTQALINPT